MVGLYDQCRPLMENLDAYLASIQRVQQANNELRGSNLGFCDITIRRLVLASTCLPAILARSTNPSPLSSYTRNRPFESLWTPWVTDTKSGS